MGGAAAGPPTPPGGVRPSSSDTRPAATARVDTTKTVTDWTKTKQSHASLVHDTGLANGHHSKIHTTLLTGGGGSFPLLLPLLLFLVV
jgi:hypothetical protein